MEVVVTMHDETAAERVRNELRVFNNTIEQEGRSNGLDEMS